RHGERVAEEVHEGRGCLAESGVLVDEARSDDVSVGEAGGGGENLSPGGGCGGGGLVGPGGGGVWGGAARRGRLLDGGGAGGAAPATRVGDDRLADGGRRLGGGVPNAAAGEDLVRADVQVVAGRVDVLGPFVPEVDSEVCLVGRLVLREACVSVDAEEGASA